MQLLKQSTASTVYVGPVLDSAGAAVTTAVVGDFRLIKNGTAATLSGATVTHDANGYYTVALTTSNTDTTGRLTLSVGNTAMSMSTHRYSVLLASVYDALITNATNSTGGLPTATGAISAMSGAISTLTASGVRTELTTELGRIDATVSSRMATYTQPTGFLAATFPTTVASPTNITSASGVTLAAGTGLGNQTANITGSITSVTNRVTANTDQWNGVGVTGMPMPTFTLPTNFSSLVIAAGGYVVVAGDTFGNTLNIPSLASQSSLDSVSSAVAALPTANQNRDAVVNADPDGAYDASAWIKRVIIGSTPQREVAVTGSHHVAADIHELQAGVITAADFATAAIDANALASDAAAEIAARVADEPLAGHTTAGTLGKVLGDAGTGITTLLSRITTTVYNTFVDLAQMIIGDGTVDAQWSGKAMENIPVSGGTGARTVTITVRDLSSNPIQNASVRVSRTGESYILQTNASGVVSFSLNDATWTVAITAAGFSFSPVSLVVSSNVSQTYSMTAAGGGVTPSDPPFCTGYWVVYNQNGTVQAGSQVSIQASSPPAGSTGIVMEDAVRTATADNNGVVQFSNLIKGSVYIVWRTGSSRKYNITVPVNAGNTQPLASIVG